MRNSGRFQRSFSVCLLATIFAISVQAGAGPDDDSSLTTIHNIDLTGAEGPSAPNYSLTMFNVKKVKVPGSRAHVIFRQFAKRVRLEFEASGIPFGKYHVGVSRGCSGQADNWTKLHEMEQTSTHLATEKSLPAYALRKAAAAGQSVLQGMNVGLFQLKGKKPVLVDCQPIK